MTTLVLIHAPLAGPLTWSFVADEMRSRGADVLVPSLTGAESAGSPYWPRYAMAVAGALEHLAADEALVLVAHSGAGNLLPLVRQISGRPVKGYLFVDAMLPEDGMRPDEVGYFRHLAVGGFIPPFSDTVLRAVGIEDPSVRHRLLGELRPLPLAVYEEPVPVFAGWPDAPCAYLRFTRTLPSAYERFVQRARGERWAYRELDGGHFHMLVDPSAVVSAIMKLLEPMGIPVARSR